MARGIQALLFVVALMVSMVASSSGNKQRHHYGFLQQGHDYSDALSKSILFFEGQRSGKLPSTQRMTWRKDSALQDGQKNGVDLAGGYYDAGDNVKFGFPMAFTTTLLAWSIIEFGANMGSELQHALEAVKWGTDYLLKATAEPNKVYVQIGDPYSDHNCWERPEDMDTDRTPFFVDAQHPGSEVAAETAAALAASSIAFRSSDSSYADQLLSRATQVFDFADKFKGSYNDSLGQWVCPFYCDFNGYQDELIWGAAWMYKATNKREYLNYVFENENKIYWGKGAYGEFGWDDKHGGIAVLLCKDENKSQNSSGVSFCERSEEFVCAVLPESPTKTVTYSPGGLMFRPGGSNIQHPTALGFLLVVLGRQFSHTDRTIHCGGAQASPARLIEVAKSQVDYILGDNPLKMSYMVGYGDKFPRRIHHRAASLPSLDAHRDRMGCKDGTPYYESKNPDPNELTGALVGGPDQSDGYTDSRSMFVGSEPTTYMNAAMVGLLASFRT